MKWLIILLIAIVPLFLGGFVLMKFYGWFLPFDVPELTYPQFVGLAMFISFLKTRLTYGDYLRNKEEWDDYGGYFIANVLLYVILLTMGWVIHLIIQ